MRKMILALAVVLLAAPAWAAVTISVTKISDTKVAINYNATTESQLVRAFALDVTVTDGNIVDIGDYTRGDNKKNYGIFPGNFSLYITVNGTTGMVDSWDDPNYTPVAPADDPGALGGIGTAGATLEMGSLYDTNAPAKTGVLCTVTVSAGTTKLCVNGNAIRGNIVMEDAAEVVPVQACIDLVVIDPDCFPSTFTTYADWVTYKKPNCWCQPPKGSGYQCDGDGDGLTEGALKYRVFSKDLGVMVSQWKKAIALVTNPCADFDHKAEGALKYRVFSKDLGILVAKWKKKDVDLPGNCGALTRPE